VINIGSVVSEVTPPNSVVYSATKGAVDAVTRVVAKELGASSESGWLTGEVVTASGGIASWPRLRKSCDRASFPLPDPWVRSSAG
jgi:hypothetical protein